MRARSQLLTLIAAAVLAAPLAGCAAHVMPDVHDEAERLASARRMIADRDYLDAIDFLKTYISNAAGQAQVDEAVYLLGKSYLDTRQYPLAQGEFERLVRDYPESDSAGAAAFRLGEALLGQSRSRDFDQEFTEKAIGQWQTYLRAYPGHWLNAEAERRVQDSRARLGHKLVDAGVLYTQLRLWGPARVYLERALSEFGDTSSAIDAEFALAQLDARQGRRAEAMARLKSLEERFPGREITLRAAKERTRLEKKKS